MNLVGTTGSARINPIYLEGEAKRESARPLGITADQWGHFLGRAFRAWYARRSSGATVEPFESYRRFMSGDTGSLCCDDSGRCGRSHLGVDTHGVIYQCGRAMDTSVLRFGDLRTHSFEQVLDESLKQKLNRRSLVLHEGECAGCRLFHMCHGGCPIDGQMYYGDWYRKTIFCAAKQVFLKEYLLPIFPGALPEALGADWRHGCSACRSLDADSLAMIEPGPAAADDATSDS
jgi:radical SAM protein with 4Fe4S-binding SPASM domain